MKGNPVRITSFLITGIVAFALAMSAADAQPGGKKGDKGGKGGGETLDQFVARLMAFNKAKDGKLTKTELTDPRLHDLFDRADANKDGSVTRAELEALFQRENLPGGGFGGDKGKGPGDKKGGFGDKKGKDGFGKGPFGKGGPPQPGTVLAPFVQDALNLSEEQRNKVADLQKDVDAKLDQILTAEQKAQLRDIGKSPFGDKKGFPFGDKKGPPGK
jgi:EF hand domain-containing protein